MSASRRASLAVIVPVAALIIVQFLPYGRDHSVPAAGNAPAWDSPRTLELAKRACFDCHSNETKWPSYASVAPFSWMVQYDVDTGRRHLNFSEWDKKQQNAKDAPEELLEGEMPLPLYRWTHREGALTENERHALVSGLRRTLELGPTAASQKNRGALERWLVQASTELQFGIVQNTKRW